MPSGLSDVVVLDLTRPVRHHDADHYPIELSAAHALPEKISANNLSLGINILS